MADDQLTFTTAAGGQFTVDLTFAGSATTGVAEAISGQDLKNGDDYVIQALLPTSVSGPDNEIDSTSTMVDSEGLGFTIDVSGTIEDAILYYDSAASTDELEFKTPSATSYSSEAVSNVILTQNVCFVEGTRILTERGEVAIEDLHIGDLVVTTYGARRPIKWLGHRRVDCTRHPRAEDALPVRISAHAFGPDRPSRDLYVSPGHSLCVDVLGEVLVRAGSLVNGATIQQIEVESVVYWHLELDSHDILLADNLPAESYLEMENRDFFVESGVVELASGPDAGAAAMGRGPADFCRPLHADGPVLEAVRAQLHVRAKTLGWTLIDGAPDDLRLEVDGARVAPSIDGLKASFIVPADARDVRLVSSATKPCHLPGGNRDTRRLGVCVKGLTVGERPVALDDVRLGEGFHQLERESWGSFRWTNGEARLPASLFAQAPEGRRLSVELLAPPLPHWVAPASRELAVAA